jgi:hypothetical protein
MRQNILRGKVIILCLSKGSMSYERLFVCLFFCQRQDTWHLVTPAYLCPPGECVRIHFGSVGTHKAYSFTPKVTKGWETVLYQTLHQSCCETSPSSRHRTFRSCTTATTIVSRQSGDNILGTYLFPVVDGKENSKLMQRTHWRKRKWRQVIQQLATSAGTHSFSV